MILTWLGTAGFIVKTKEAEICFDPFLSRGEGQTSPFSVNSFENCRALFVGHGHFDHTYDIPKIVSGTDLQVYAPGLTGAMLNFRGVAKQRLLVADKDKIIFEPLKLRGFLSQHVKFDLPLVLSTMKRCGVKGCLHMLPLGIAYPKGLVQTYLFEAKGKKVLYISSAGCSDQELKRYQQEEVDILLCPLQGHSMIQEIAARQAAIINPKLVIPHHHDDFYPPLSQEISVESFKDQLKIFNFKGQLLEIPLFSQCQI